ncbi:MAG TPA: EamA family transporter [Polyangiaceae bacterium]|nr:EamA family transporter [Polyangiaceae bacterium]
MWCLLAAALFGASTPAAKLLANAAGPFLLSGILYLGAAIAVTPWLLRGAGWRGVGRRSAGRRSAVDRRNRLRLLGAVVFGGMIGPVCLLTGLRMAHAGSVSLWLNLETVATAVLARLFFKEHLALRTWAAVALVLCASMLLEPGSPEGGAAVGWVALACLAWGIDNNLTSLIDAYSPTEITFAKGVAAGSMNLGLGLWFDPAALTAWTAGAGLAVGALGYGASLLLYVAGAQHLGATRSQLLFSTAPLWGLLVAWLVLGEPVLASQLAAAPLMGLALWLWHHEHHEHPHRHAAVSHRHWHRHDDGHHQHPHGDDVAPHVWHSHQHLHEAVEHQHPHRPDLHHRHAHSSKGKS